MSFIRLDLSIGGLVDWMENKSNIVFTSLKRRQSPRFVGHNKRRKLIDDSGRHCMVVGGESFQKAVEHMKMMDPFCQNGYWFCEIVNPCVKRVNTNHDEKENENQFHFQVIQALFSQVRLDLVSSVYQLIVFEYTPHTVMYDESSSTPFQGLESAYELLDKQCGVLLVPASYFPLVPIQAVNSSKKGSYRIHLCIAKWCSEHFPFVQLFPREQYAILSFRPVTCIWSYKKLEYATPNYVFQSTCECKTCVRTRNKQTIHVVQ